MSLVIKSWSLKSNPAVGEPHVRVIARESGFWSFVFSLLGIDATTTFQVSSTRMEFEQGSLSGFIRRLTPFEKISSTFYGRHKPWKTSVALLGGAVMVGSAIGNAWAFLVFLIIGVLGAGLYYFLNRELTFGFNEDSGTTAAITFKRSVIEGQEIDEEQLKKVISVIEHLIKQTQPQLAPVDIGGHPGGARMGAPGPTQLGELVRGPEASPLKDVGSPVAPVHCPQCSTKVIQDDVFCSGCGHKVR